MMDDVKAYPPYLDYPKPRKTTTNADRIRTMSDEELAAFFCPEKPRNSPWCDPIGRTRCEKTPCRKCMLKWLQQPAERDK